MATCLNCQWVGVCPMGPYPFPAEITALEAKQDRAIRKQGNYEHMKTELREEEIAVMEAKLVKMRAAYRKKYKAHQAKCKEGHKLGRNEEAIKQLVKHKRDEDKQWDF